MLCTIIVYYIQILHKEVFTVPLDRFIKIMWRIHNFQLKTLFTHLKFKFGM